MKKTKTIDGVSVAGSKIYYLFISPLSGVSKNKGPKTGKIWPRIYPFSSEHLIGVIWKSTEEGQKKKKNERFHFVSKSSLKLLINLLDHIGM